jgi:hypothetical protein
MSRFWSFQDLSLSARLLLALWAWVPLALLVSLPAALALFRSAQISSWSAYLMGSLTWMGLAAFVMNCLWGLLMVTWLARVVGDGALRGAIRTELWPWAAGFVVQGALSMAVAAALASLVPVSSWAWAPLVLCGLVPIAQIPVSAPLLSAALLVWPRAAPGIGAGLVFGAGLGYLTQALGVWLVA